MHSQMTTLLPTVHHIVQTGIVSAFTTDVLLFVLVQPFYSLQQHAKLAEFLFHCDKELNCNSETVLNLTQQCRHYT